MISPFLNDTTDGVVRLPSGFAIIFDSVPSRTATAEFVVPKSIPMILDICFSPFYFNFYFAFLSFVHSFLSFRTSFQLIIYNYHSWAQNAFVEFIPFLENLCNRVCWMFIICRHCLNRHVEVMIEITISWNFFDSFLFKSMH